MYYELIIMYYELIIMYYELIIMYSNVPSVVTTDEWRQFLYCQL